MNNIASFETAKRLKEAGFQQPEPEFGQFWYNGSDLLVVVKYLGAKEWIACPLSGANWTRLFSAAFRHPIVFGEPVFAPSATDILRELQRRTRTGFSWILTPPEKTATTWQCYGFEKEEGVDFNAEHENPSEVCAINFLKIFGK